MLRELSVQNLALIEDVHVELDSGFSVWTGETGAGKSLLLAALGLTLGAKAGAELVREGKNEGRASAVFQIVEPTLRPAVEAILNSSIEDQELIIHRRISAQGRGGAYVNGMPVTISTLRALGERLVDLHGQHENQAILQPDRQRELLDAYGGLDDLIATYRAARERHETLRRRKTALVKAVEGRERERALLEFEKEELKAADPRFGEYDELTTEARRLARREQLRSAAADGFMTLYEADRSAQELIARVARRLRSLIDPEAELARAADDLDRLAEEVRDVAHLLRDFERGDDLDPSKIEEIEARLALYRRLSGRFRCAPDELSAKAAEIEAKLDDLERDETDLRELDEPLLKAWKEVRDASIALSAARRSRCAAFANAAQIQLKDLGLVDALLSVEIESAPLSDDPMTSAPSGDGADRIEIVFAANPGEVPRPLRKAASGGELSRVTLAIKTVLAEVDRLPTLIFDEIDAGVGGRLGAVLGRKLAELARTRQVVCVTHLPQLACHAARHWAVRKQTAEGRTRTTIDRLDSEERIAELAAMIRGASAAEGTRREALAMLAEAEADAAAATEDERSERREPRVAKQSRKKIKTARSVLQADS